MLLATMIVLPVVLALAGVLLLVGWRLHLVPRRGLGTGYLLVSFAAYGLFYLAIRADSLVLRPARLQKSYLGATVAGPFSLTRLEEGGFQDPYSEWRYALSPSDAARLQNRCMRDRPVTAGTCQLYSGMDERWFAEVRLERNMLVMMDGLH